MVEETLWNNNIRNNPMKDSKGCWFTQSLFIEWKREGCPAKWTIYEQDYIVDGKTYPSLKKLFLAYDHVPGNEYEFALEVIGSWEHWQVLTKSKRLGEFISAWREELEVKTRAKAIKSIISTSLENTSAGATASKWLAEKGYAPKRGRPTKAEKAGYIKQETSLEKEIEGDLERVGLKIVGSRNG